MGSRRMALMNPFTEQHWRCRNREQIDGHRQIYGIGESGMDAYTLTYVKQVPMEIYSVTQGAQTGAL